MTDSVHAPGDAGDSMADSADGQAICSCSAVRPAGSERGPSADKGPCRHKDKSPQHRRGDRAAKRPKGRDEGYNLPKHVRNCANQGGRDWYLWTWPVGDPTLKTRAPYTCGSWRCDGPCATHDAHQLFARLNAAVGRPEHDPTGWVFVVLTIDREGYYSGKPWPDAETAYRSLSDMTGKFMKRLRRSFEKIGWRDPGNRWAMVIESHMSGWPHANLMIYSPELATELRTEACMRELAGKTGRDAIILGTPQTPERGDPSGVRALLGQHAVETDWGLESTADAARNNEALAGYLVKLAGNPDANVGELAKLTQTPKAAPFRFRRLRSGKLFLPPRNKDDRFTGALVKRMRDRETGFVFACVPTPKGGHKPERLAAVAMAQRIEDRCIEADEEREWYEQSTKRGPPTIPLVTRWQGDQMLPPPEREPETWDEAISMVRSDLRAQWKREKGLRKRSEHMTSSAEQLVLMGTA